LASHEIGVHSTRSIVDFVELVWLIGMGLSRLGVNVIDLNDKGFHHIARIEDELVITHIVTS